MMQRKLAGEPPRIYEAEILGKDRRRIALELSTRVIYKDGKAVGIQGIGRDVTQRRHIEQALHAANEQLTKWVAELEQRNREGVLLTKMGEMLQIAMTPEEAYAVVGKAAQELFPEHSGGLMVIDASRNLVEAAVTWGEEPGERVFAQEECWALRGGRVHRVEDARVGPVCRHVGNVPVSAICAPMMAQGEIIGMYHLQGPVLKPGVGAKEDWVARLAVTVAEHVALALSNLKLRATLRDQSIRDSLTGLFNRRFLETSMARELLRAARKQRPLGVMLLDLDHFKRFNDSYGHLAGDVLLRELGSFLQHSLRGDDIACRYGGEEFTLIFPETSLQTMRQRAEQICAEVRKLRFPFDKQRTGAVTISIGVAMYPEHGVTMNELLAAADAALYAAKSEGRDRVIVAAARPAEAQKT
jgi:diguanylate cyclase (GGDEF)-like protein